MKLIATSKYNFDSRFKEHNPNHVFYNGDYYFIIPNSVLKSGFSRPKENDDKYVVNFSYGDFEIPEGYGEKTVPLKEIEDQLSLIKDKYPELLI